MDEPPTPAPTLVVVAHGSRDPAALRTVRALLRRVQRYRPRLTVRLGHIEIEQPSLTDTLASLGGGRAVLVPLLLGPGHHITHDLPAAAAAAPRLRTTIAAPLGPHPLLVRTLHARLVEAGWRDEPHRAAGTGVVLAAAGSRDPRSAAATRRTAALLSARLGGVPVVPAYASAAAPTVPDAVRDLAARGRSRIALASYFTAPGHFATRAAADVAAHAPWIAAAPLGDHPDLARLLLRRYDECHVRQRDHRAAGPVTFDAWKASPHLMTTTPTTRRTPRVSRPNPTSAPAAPPSSATAPASCTPLPCAGSRARPRS